MRKIILILGILLSITTSAIVVDHQSQNQKRVYVGDNFELVGIVGDDQFPVVVHDGVTTGGVELVSSDAVVVTQYRVATTNSTDWTGWSTSGSVLNDVIWLAGNDWLEFPYNGSGILDIAVEGADSSISFGVFNTDGETVMLPYNGIDGTVRISRRALLMGDSDTVGITRVIIGSYSKLDRVDNSVFIPNVHILTAPRDPDQIARLDNVISATLALEIYANAAVTNAALDTTKTVRGYDLRVDGDGQLTGGTNAIALTINGRELLSASAPAEMVSNLVFTATYTNDIANIAAFAPTNFVDAAPFVEWSDKMDPLEWTRLDTLITNTYPSVTNGAYYLEYEVLLAETNSKFFRVQYATAPSEVRVSADFFDVGMAGIVAHGSVNGTNRTATLRYNFTDNVWFTEVIDD